MNLRTDYTVKPLYGRRKQSVQMPKLNHFNVIKGPSPAQLELNQNSARMDDYTKASL
jgi:hypothetical protein